MNLFDKIRSSGWTRPKDRWIGGVCGAISGATGWDVALVRGVVAVLGLLFWLPVTLYALAWLFIPDAGTKDIELQKLGRGQFDLPQLWALLLLLISVANPLPYVTLFGAVWYALLGIGLTAFVLWLIFNASKNNTSTTPPTWTEQPHMMSNEPPVSPAPGAYPAPQAYPAPGANPAPQAYPAPGTYQTPPANLPQTPRAPRISNATSFLTLGGLALLGAFFALISGLSSNSTLPDRLTALWFAIASLTMGIVLVISALKGRRGGWFLPITIICSIVFFGASQEVQNRLLMDLTGSPSQVEASENFYRPSHPNHRGGEPVLPPYADSEQSEETGEQYDDATETEDLEIANNIVIVDLRKSDVDWNNTTIDVSSSVLVLKIPKDASVLLDLDMQNSVLLTRDGADGFLLPKARKGTFQLKQWIGQKDQSGAIHLTGEVTESVVAIEAVAPTKTPKKTQVDEHSNNNPQSGGNRHE